MHLPFKKIIAKPYSSLIQLNNILCISYSHKCSYLLELQIFMQLSFNNFLKLNRRYAHKFEKLYIYIYYLNIFNILNIINILHIFAYN